MSKKKELGKGLRALLSNIEQTTNPEDKTQLVKELTNSIAMIRVDAIEVNPYQPRVEFDTEELMELAKSIKVHGLIQPITVRSLGGDQYQLISGERRLRASKMAGLNQVPAYIRVANDQEMLEMALIENIQRTDLNAVEVAISYQRLIDECALTHETLSERVGKNRSTVTNYLRLLKLPPEIQSAIKSGGISMAHARVLAGIQDIEKQLFLFKKAVSEEMSVRQMEAYAKEFAVGQTKKSKPATKDSGSSSELERLKREISSLLGTRVEIMRNDKGQGKIVINFNNDKEFNNIYDLLREIDDN
ncbi:MAG: ParB/RepB/Spo0J family partition protein [Saprospiraceae bacterium]|nr:ParB/RepB/Spo0J family partition protein [Saprospiraceae bacterium]